MDMDGVSRALIFFFFCLTNGHGDTIPVAFLHSESVSHKMSRHGWEGGRFEVREELGQLHPGREGCLSRFLSLLGLESFCMQPV